MTTILEIKGLECWYGKVHVLKGVDMKINRGDIVSIIGPNGAGKSTTLKCIFGLVKKVKGSIVKDGKNLSKLKPNNIVRNGISFVPQGRSVFPNLTVLENLELGAYIREDEQIKDDIQKMFDEFPILYKRRHKKAGLLSGGEQQLLSMARALMIHPEILMLDEPSLGLSPHMRKIIFDKILDLNKQGITIIMVEQNARLSLSVSDKAYVLELGKNKLEGKGKDLLHDDRVKKLYLGG